MLYSYTFLKLLIKLDRRLHSLELAFACTSAGDHERRRRTIGRVVVALANWAMAIIGEKRDQKNLKSDLS